MHDGTSEQADFETIRRAFAVFNGFDGPGSDELWWRTDGNYAPVTLMVNCNDLFFWGCADCEVLTPNDINDLERAAADAKSAAGADGERHAHLLWVARKRAMRPQGAYYKFFDVAMHPLFNACGPHRPAELGNPTATPDTTEGSIMHGDSEPRPEVET